MQCNWLTVHWRNQNVFVCELLLLICHVLHVPSKQTCLQHTHVGIHIEKEKRSRQKQYRMLGSEGSLSSDIHMNECMYVYHAIEASI